MVYRSPTAIACQPPQSLPTVHSLLTATELANGVQIANRHSLPAATELANGIHRLFGCSGNRKPGLRLESGRWINLSSVYLSSELILIDTQPSIGQVSSSWRT